MGIFRDISEVKTYKYGVYSGFGIVDEFAAAALLEFDPELYRQAFEYTKSGASAFEVERELADLCSRRQNENIELDPHVEQSLEYAFKKIYAKFSKVRVEPLSLDEAVNVLHLETSAGYGYPGKSKGEVLDELLDQAEEIMLRVRIGEPVVPVPSLVGTRGHMHKLDSDKRRIIFMVPGAHQLIEQCYAAPIMNELKKDPDGLLFIGENLIPRLRDLVNIMHPQGSYVVKSDFDQFDKDATAAIINLAFDIVESMINFETWNGVKLRDSQKKRWKRVFDYVREYFIHTPVMSPRGETFWVNGSVPSGSAFTQLIDSIITALYLETAAHFFGHSVYDTRVLGDDGQIVTAGRPVIKEWKTFFEKWFHAKLSDKKTEVRRGWVGGRSFIGYEWRKGFLWREDAEWFRLIIHPSNKVESVEKSFSRLISYMHIGGISSVRFSEFFEFFQSGYEINDVPLITDKDFKKKKEYGGVRIEEKKLFDYKRDDFVFSNITYH